LEGDNRHPSAEIINVCPKCDQENTPNDVFCGVCGYNLQKITRVQHARTIRQHKRELKSTSVLEYSTGLSITFGTNLMSFGGTLLI
jgi:predicted amidophosphoribosyltransferase